MEVNIDQTEEFRFIDLVEKLPLTIARKEVNNYLSGISPKTLANADCSGIGPSKKKKIGKTVVYETKSLLEWLDKISTN